MFAPKKIFLNQLHFKLGTICNQKSSCFFQLFAFCVQLNNTHFSTSLEIMSKLLRHFDFAQCIRLRSVQVAQDAYINLSGVIGNCLILFPVALYIALAIAGATPTRAISPTPLAPVGTNNLIFISTYFFSLITFN